MAKKILSCLFSGILLGFSQPFYFKISNFDFSLLNDYFGLLALFGYVPWFLALKNSSLRQTFWLSVFAATVQYSIVLYWIYIALHDYGYVNPVLSVMITILLALVMGFENGVYMTIGKHISQKFNRSFFLFSPLALVALETFRNYFLFGGFPWGNTGYSLGRIGEFSQTACIFGVYGLVFLVGLSNSLIALGIDNLKNKKILIISFTGLFIILSGVFGFGYTRLNQTNNYEQEIKVALLQGNIPQEIKSSRDSHTFDILNTYLNLNKKAIDLGAKLVVWPESAYPKVLKQDINSLEFPKEQQVASIIGASAYGFNTMDKKGYHYHNSAFLSDYKNQIISRYDKSHLVPFGEYVPWPFKGLVQAVVPGMGAFLPGTSYEPVLLSLSEEKEILIGTTVCYEGIFPEISRAYAKNGAKLLVNITNDAWYGYSSAPYQHLLMYKLRAVETGLPYVRATNSGISALIDAKGIIKSETKLFESDVLIGEIGILDNVTPFVLMGDLFSQVITTLFFLLFLSSSISIGEIRKNVPFIKIISSIIFLALLFAVQIYYGQSKFLIDESAKTKSLVIAIYCFIISLGLVSSSKRVTQALKISGLILSVASLIFGFVEGREFFVGLIIGLGLLFWSFRR